MTEATGEEPPTVIRKYANRRLYDTAAGRFVTLEDLRAMVVRGERFQVIDARSGRDLTASVLAQIIAEQESRGESLLPQDVLREVIALYSRGLADPLAAHLRDGLAGFDRQVATMQRLGELGRRNLEAFQDAMLGRSRSPGGTTGHADAAAHRSSRDDAAPAPDDAEEGRDQEGPGARDDTTADRDELAREVRELREALEAMQRRLDAVDRDAGDEKAE